MAVEVHQQGAGVEGVEEGLSRRVGEVLLVGVVDLDRLQPERLAEAGGQHVARPCELVLGVVVGQVDDAAAPVPGGRFGVVADDLVDHSLRFDGGLYRQTADGDIREKVVAVDQGEEVVAGRIAAPARVVIEGGDIAGMPPSQDVAVVEGRVPEQQHVLRGPLPVVVGVGDEGAGRLAQHQAVRELVVDVLHVDYFRGKTAVPAMAGEPFGGVEKILVGDNQVVGSRMRRPQPRRGIQCAAGRADAGAVDDDVLGPGGVLVFEDRCVERSAGTVYQHPGEKRFHARCRGGGFRDGRSRTRQTACRSRVRG